MNISHEQIEFNNELNKKKTLKNFVNQLLNSKNKQSQMQIIKHRLNQLN